MISSNLEYLTEKINLVLSSYPTLGITLEDLIQTVREYCRDDRHTFAKEQIVEVINSLGLIKKGRRYFSK